ncbi:SDR family NAD(P)-dependent oxidoreductase [Pseudenhygromyxa sp. WMMC2535]|nr:SDR family NAD(P)-dependent oxidoreductase [Pseudenhygromyxa sp. WMMC2535]NVB37310.1 SDR family NAD(P)-dependent oxidoreductase [Pseudenhygromyxa sp. WMMC2535]
MGILSSHKRILITGGSKGIGREAARQLAAAGHRVVLAARGRDALVETRDAIIAAGARPRSW